MDSCGEATASLQIAPLMPKEEMAAELYLVTAFRGGQGYSPVSNLPTVSRGKRNPSLQGALLILECSIRCSYMWLTHLARLHRTTDAYSSQKGNQMISPSKELKLWYFFCQQTRSQGNHLSTTVHCYESMILACLCYICPVWKNLVLL